MVVATALVVVPARLNVPPLDPSCRVRFFLLADESQASRSRSIGIDRSIEQAPREPTRRYVAVNFDGGARRRLIAISVSREIIFRSQPIFV